MADAAGDRSQHYPYVWFTISGILALGAIVSVTLLFSEGYRYAQACSVVSASLCAVAVAATLVSMRMDRHRRSAGMQMEGLACQLQSLNDRFDGVLTQLGELRTYVEERAARVEDVARYAAEAWGQANRAHAEHLFDQAMKRVDDLAEAVERVGGHTDVAAAYEVDHEGAARPGNVVDFPPQNTQVYQLGIEEGLRRARQQGPN